MAEIEDRLQVERLGNLIQGFGWKITNQEFTEDKIIIKMERSRIPEGESTSPGPD